MPDELDTPTGERSNQPAPGTAATKPAVPASTPTKFVGSSTGQSLAAPTDPPTTPEDVPVVGHGGQQMSPEAISERVQRATKKTLRDLFGKDVTPEEAKQIIEKSRSVDGAKILTPDEQKEYDRLKRIEEARKRSRQTSEQRIQAEIKTRDERIKQLESELGERRIAEVAQKQDAVVVSVMSDAVDSKFIRYAKRDLAEHIVEMQKSDPAKFAKFGEKQLKSWVQTYVAEHPEFAKKPSQPASESGEKTPIPAPTTKAQPVVTRRVTTTKAPARPPSAAPQDGPGMFKGKTVKPGLPNSMTKAELREYNRINGRRNPY